MPGDGNDLTILESTMHLLPEEAAHNIALFALKHGLVRPKKAIRDERLKMNVFGLQFDNPVGLAAGFDKNAECISALAGQGFGFIETGTVTPLAQIGNEKPRLFRLKEDQAIINRLGFNGKGGRVYTGNLKKYMEKAKIRPVIGANIGKNRDTLDPASDYRKLIYKMYGQSDYITINISSPNTIGLRLLQKADKLGWLLDEIMEEADRQSREKGKVVPLLIKIAPDLALEDLREITEMAIEYNVDGLIVGNTTIKEREGLKSRRAAETGGLSGSPLFKLSTDVLRNVYDFSGGKIPLIGCGGIFSAEDAYAKIRAGASLVQVYTGLIYKGFGLVNEINAGLLKLLDKDGFHSISEAIGADFRSGRN